VRQIAWRVEGHSQTFANRLHPTNTGLTQLLRSRMSCMKGNVSCSISW